MFRSSISFRLGFYFGLWFISSSSINSSLDTTRAIRVAIERRLATAVFLSARRWLFAFAFRTWRRLGLLLLLLILRQPEWISGCLRETWNAWAASAHPTLVQIWTKGKNFLKRSNICGLFCKAFNAVSSFTNMSVKDRTFLRYAMPSSAYFSYRDRWQCGT